MEKYKIRFNLRNIHPNNPNLSNPFELQFKIINTDRKIEEKLRKDFVFELKNKWIVSANNGNLNRSSQWYIKGSNHYIEENKKYYNKINKEHYHEKEFIEELLELLPSIEYEEYEGEFNFKEGIMRLKTTKKPTTKRIKRTRPRGIRSLKQVEFLEIMSRLELIDEEIKKEKELFEIKIKSLRLEKEYLKNRFKENREE